MDYAKYATDARQLLRGFRAFDELAQAFESVANAIAAKDEAEKRAADLNAEILAAQQTLAALKAEAKQEQAAAKAKADAVLQLAEKRAADLISGAEKMVEDAKSGAEAVMAEATAKVAIAKRDAVEAEVRRDAAQRELADVESRMAKAQAQIKKLLG